MEFLAGGVVLALLALGMGVLVRRMLGGVWRLLCGRLLRPGPDRPALRLTRSRALARSESRRAATLAQEVARLRVEVRLARQAGPEPRFQRAKREFARRFHPDRVAPRASDRGVRIALFREFWAVLRGIERDR